MRTKKKSPGAVPRGSCNVCHQRFADATDQEFRLRFRAHLGSLRHNRYLELQTAVPPPRFVVLRSQEQIRAIFERLRQKAVI